MEKAVTDWKELATESHYRTAVAVQDALVTGNVDDATVGLEELIDALSRAERRALRSQLIRLMAHVVKWYTQPDKRSHSWVGSIDSARFEIAETQEETPSLTREVVEEMWDKCTRAALAQAKKEMNAKPLIDAITWKQVFEDEYELETE